jgi:hypothetical protein
VQQNKEVKVKIEKRNNETCVHTAHAQHYKEKKERKSGSHEEDASGRPSKSERPIYKKQKKNPRKPAPDPSSLHSPFAARD